MKSFFYQQNPEKYFLQVLPLLKHVVVDVFSKVDMLRDVFLLGSMLCHSCYRQLEVRIKMQNTMKESCIS